MNHLLVIFFLICFSFSLQSQTETNKKERYFGVAINSGASTAPFALSTNPTGVFYINRHQIELGYGLYPFNNEEQRIWGTHLNYKYYPNGIDQRFSLYFITSLTYTQKVENKKFYNDIGPNPYIMHYQNKFEYLSLTGGYGFDLKIFKNGYIGTCLNIGLITRSATFELLTWPEEKMFEEYGPNVALRLNIGYRF
jgi:hypothetical protein